MPLPARAALSFYTTVESCRGLDIDPFVYLRNALTTPLNGQLAAKYVIPEAWRYLRAPLLPRP
jgi:hypothetical protein